MWYWVYPDNHPHPFKLVKLAEYNSVTGERSYPVLGLMAMDDFGTLVPVSP